MKLQCFALAIIGFLILKCGFAEKREFEFDKIYACEQSYGTELTIKTNVQSYLSCVTTCIEDVTCTSCTYNPTNKTCKTNNDTWMNPPTSGCTQTVFYGKKLDITAGSNSIPECVTGSSCTSLVQNVRLCDGGGAGVCDPTKGRVEVFYNNTWGTICDDAWHSYDYYYEYYGGEDYNALVLCGMLGYASGLSHQSAYFGVGVDPIWLDDIQCVGTETSIFDCPKDPWGSHNCAHFEDIGVTCS